MTEQFRPRPGDCMIDDRHKNKIPWLIISVDYQGEMVTVKYIDPRETMGFIHVGTHHIVEYDSEMYGFVWSRL